MLTIKRKILTILLFISSTCLFGQAENDDDPVLANGIYITPAQLIFPELILTYEHFFDDKIAISYSLGYKYPVGSGNKLEPIGYGLPAVYELQYMFNEFSNAVYISVGPTLHFDENREFFIHCELFNRFYWFDDKQLTFNNTETDGYNSVRSERNNVTGFKVLTGTNRKISLSKSHLLILKLYGGLGIRYKVYHYENEGYGNSNSTVSEISAYQEERGTIIVPSIQLGLKIGIAGKMEQ